MVRKWLLWLTCSVSYNPKYILHSVQMGFFCSAREITMVCFSDEVHSSLLFHISFCCQRLSPGKACLVTANLGTKEQFRQKTNQAALVPSEGTLTEMKIKRFILPPQICLPVHHCKGSNPLSYAQVLMRNIA